MRQTNFLSFRHSFLYLLMFLGMVGCKDDNDQAGSQVFNPSLPVEVTGFNPTSGGSGTKFFVYGSNFGTDKSQIKLTVNDKPAVVISSDGTTIYAMIPERAGSGSVKVFIGSEEVGVKEAVAETDFQYEGNWRVGTLSGWRDRDGHSAVVDGPMTPYVDEEGRQRGAQYVDPYWLCFDEDRNLLVAQEYNSIRKLNIRAVEEADKKTTTLFYTGNGLNRPRTLVFSPGYDTLYVANDGGREDMAVGYTLKREKYRQVRRLITGGWCNGSAVHPKDGTIFYNSYDQGELFKWHRETGKSELLYRVGDVRWEYNIQFEPNGEFAYIVCRNQHYIMKAFYDPILKTLSNPSIFVGKKGAAGYADGVGTQCMFHEPHQGCFDEEGNFYLCDVLNQCIRKISPDGMVTTFAGRPREYGYADGNLRNEAQFDRPSGIVYDAESETFYVADEKNHRIRTIRKE